MTCSLSVSTTSQMGSIVTQSLVASDARDCVEVTFSYGDLADQKWTEIGAYVDAAMNRASLEQIDDGSYYAEIEELPGVWSAGQTIVAAIAELREVVEDWIVLKLRDGDQDFPPLDGINLNR